MVLNSVNEVLFSISYSVYAYPVPEGKSGQQVVDTIQKQLEQLGAVKSGNFCVDCETYQSNVQTGKMINNLSNSVHVYVICIRLSYSSSASS